MELISINRSITLGSTELFKEVRLNAAKPWQELCLDILVTGPGTLIPYLSFGNKSFNGLYQIKLQEKSKPKELSLLAPIGQSQNKDKPSLGLFDDSPLKSQNIKSEIDFFKVSSFGLRTYKLTLRLESPSQELSDLSLKIQWVTSTPIDIEDEFRQVEFPTLKEELSTVQLAKLKSQMLQPIKRHREICNPTTLYHLGQFYSKFQKLHTEHYSQIIKKTLNQKTTLYGIWPQAIYSAQTLGLKGYFKTNVSLNEVIEHLNNVGPIGLSIKYSEGELRNSPLKQTSGHLVTLVSMDKNHCIVLDSASKNQNQVYKNYLTIELLKSWAKHHRLVYFFNKP